jgi:hypothetical protein
MKTASHRGNRTKVSVVAIIASTLIWVFAAAQNNEAVVDYPSDYRAWQHTKTMIIQPGHPLENPFGGIHHIYANAGAMSGLSTGKYENGAVFVFDLLDYIEKDGAVVEAKRKRLDVMQFNAELFATTGSWGYDTFVGDSKTARMDQDVVTACYQCHMAASGSSYVFSKYRP